MSQKISHSAFSILIISILMNSLFSEEASVNLNKGEQKKVSNYLSTPYFATDVITAGGNYMTDGLGVSASSSLIYEENSMSNNQLQQDMLDYYGIHTYHAIDDPNNTYIA